MLKDLPMVSVVVIGHNEAKNLEKCMVALRNMTYPRERIEVIFVDSNSTDGSVDIAGKYADKCIILNSVWPTAGMAFNKGIIESSYQYVHITAGDIILDSNYLLEAITTLEQRSDIVSFTGYFVELNDNGWNKILGYRRLDDTDYTEHFVNTPNGGTFRKSALVSVNGYDERIKKGQETELGQRFQKAGYKILYRHVCQGVHDFDISTTSDLLQRFLNDGRSSAFMMLLARRESDSNNFREYWDRGIKRILIFTSLLGGSALLLLLRLYLAASALLIIYYFLVIVRELLKNRIRPRGYKLYRLTMTLGSVIAYFGMLTFFARYYTLRLQGINLIQARRGLHSEDYSDVAL